MAASGLALVMDEWVICISIGGPCNRVNISDLRTSIPSEEEEEVTTASSTLNNRKALCTSLRCSSEHESDLVRTTWRSYGSRS